MQLRKLTLDKIEHYIVFTKENCEDKVRFDLKKKVMEKFDTRKEEWIEVERQYKFFRLYNIDQVEYKEEKFKKFIEIVRKLNNNCRNLSTFVTRMSEVMYIEPYIQEGIDFELKIHNRNYSRTYITIEHPINIYTKNTLNFIKKHKITITRDFENNYLNKKQLFDSFIDKMSHEDFSDEEVKNILEMIDKSYHFERFTSLVVTHHFDEMSLLNYLLRYLQPFENIQMRDSLGLLKDYCDMAQRIGRKVKKYPKYLRSMHDILVANYNAFKKTYDEERFKSLMKTDLELEDKKYAMIIPQTTQEVIQEGVSLNHCVSSYVERIINGDTYIMFMRLTECKNESLVTIEVRSNKIVQAKGAYNRTLEKEEKEFLEKYCKTKKLECAI